LFVAQQDQVLMYRLKVTENPSDPQIFFCSHLLVLTLCNYFISSLELFIFLFQPLECNIMTSAGWSKAFWYQKSFPRETTRKPWWACDTQKCRYCFNIQINAICNCI